jgi:NADPH-dependent 7-cyano-7-deazaguanine reductase QueF-like protein
MFAYQQTKLGQQTDYSSQYDPKLLCPLPRLQGRDDLGIGRYFTF